MRVMGLDVGSKTVGVAISDEMGWTAQGVETISINEEKTCLDLSGLVKLLKNTVLRKSSWACQKI